MLQSTLILILLSFLVGAGVWLIFIWAVKKGEFDDVEAPKHRMLEDDPDKTASRHDRNAEDR